MGREEEKLVLGKGAAFMKGSFRRLRQENATSEEDFQALPKPITQSETHYLGMVQFVVNQRQQLLGGVRIALFDGRQNSRDFAHGRHQGR
jgi:hypothetical protein